MALKSTSTDDSFIDSEYIRLFAALPSVTLIDCYSVDSDPNDLLHTSSFDFGITNVTKLSFGGCFISPKAMFEFLSTTRNLQSFFYSPLEMVGNLAESDPFWIRTALLANARKHSNQ